VKRRLFVAALSTASLAGCLDRAGVVGAPTDETPTADLPEGVQRLVHLDAVDDAGTDHDVVIDAAVLEPSVTAEHPTRVAVTTTNEGRERAISVGSDQCCLFNRSGGASDPEGAWLHRVGSTERVERDGDRWTRDAPADEGRAYYAYGCFPRTYAAGESLTNEYSVWDDYRTAGYLEPGTYRFEEPVRVSEPGDGAGEEDVLAEFTWGFSVRVEA